MHAVCVCVGVCARVFECRVCVRGGVHGVCVYCVHAEVVGGVWCVCVCVLGVCARREGARRVCVVCRGGVHVCVHAVCV